MGKRGPAPTPTNVLELRGNPGKRPLNKNEPKPAPIAPTCPSFLDGCAKREWKRIIPELEKMGLITLVDRACLAAYCQSYSRWVQAEAVIKEKGLVFRTRTGYEQQRPEVSISDKAKQDMVKIADRFGFNPSFRTRINLPQRDNENEFEEFLKRGRKG